MLKSIQNAPLPISYVGPDIEEGPLPSIFYFALSAKDSLSLDPFDQPVQVLLKHPVRVFSFDLPYHGEGMSAVDALKGWAGDMQEDNLLLTQYFEQVILCIRSLLLKNILIPGKIAAAGLSRGGFIASHIVAYVEEIQVLLCYAPLTQLTLAKEFAFCPNAAHLKQLDMTLLSPLLYMKKVRSYIGNRDIRVSTDACFQWTRSLVETAYEHNMRSPHIELFLKPSIGHQGHGTSKESFEEGAAWLLKVLEVVP